METGVIEARNKSDARLLRSLPKRNGAEVIEPVNLLVDMAMRRLKEENMLDSDVDERKLMKSLQKFARQNGFSAHVIAVDDFLEEYEDMVLGFWIEESMLDPEPDVSESEIMEILRQ